MRGNGRSRSQACDLSPHSPSRSTAVLVASPAATPRSPTKVERRASLEAAVVRAMNRVRAAKGLRPAEGVPEPSHGSARPLGGDARERVLRPRVGRRNGIQRADHSALHEPRLEDVVGRRGAPREPGHRHRREGDRRPLARAHPRIARSSSRRPGATPESACSTRRARRTSSAEPTRSSSPPTSDCARDERAPQ